MPQLYLTLSGVAENTDIAVEFDDRASVQQLVDAIAHHLRAPEPERLTIERVSRATVALDRYGRISHQDLRSGDSIRLAPDTGLRAQRTRASVGSLRFVNGPHAGHVVAIGRGETTIGRTPENDVALGDSMASRRHAKLIATDVVEVADLGSTNGVLVNGRQISGAHRLAHGDVVLIGDTELAFDQTAMAPAELADATNAVEFNRPPRVGSIYAGAEIDLPTPPEDPRPQRIPAIAAILPVLMGVGLYFLTRNIATVAFIALSPLLLLGNWWENKRSGRAEHKALLAAFEEDLAAAVARLDHERQVEYAARLDASPAISELPAHLHHLSHRLWERQPEDDDFLELRVGLAPQPSRTKVKLGTGGSRIKRAELAEIPPRYAILPPVPVTVPLPEVGALGVAGQPQLAHAMTRSLVCQAAILQSPGELVICAMFAPEAATHWDWLKWMPHTRAPQSPIKGPHLTRDTDHHLALLDELNSVIAIRTPENSGTKAPPPEPHVLVLIDDDIALERARIVPLLEAGRAAGVSFIWTSSTTRRLPKACGAVIDIDPSGGAATVGYVDRKETVNGSTCELMIIPDAADVARTLSPIVDTSSRAGDSAEVPRTAPLVELLGGTEIMDDPTLVEDRWRESATSHSLRGPVGAGGSGAFSIDLRHDGPHGLVAGTTGAGKSELLQSMLVGLAATHSPRRVTFLLVDYKGGSAFKDCVRLPHTVGLVTDLTPALVSRALTSLRAELHRREHLLNEANAKDLIQMEEMGHPKTPPSLIIVVDEFAALAREVPEFVEGVVDVAQRGRSLGLHLMLATQRPAGVVTDNIRANTNLKIALRVASTDESADVIGSPAAGNLDRSIPGRALARLGPSELITFQSGYVGGRTSAANDEVPLLVGHMAIDGVRQWDLPRRSNHDAKAGDTDLERMVVSINAAFTRSGEDPPRRPWLDPLPDAYDLLRLPRRPGDHALTVGVVDDPAQQTQRITTFEPDRDGNVLVYGASGAGKTVALRTIAAAAALCGDAQPVHVYGLDFAGRGLDMIEPLAAVGSVVPGDDYERVTRLLRTLRETVEDRSIRFARERASTLTEYRANAGRAAEPRLLVLLDGFENFFTTFERIDRGVWLETLTRLIADGRGVGLHFALTGGRRSAFPMNITSAVPRRFVLRLANPDEYLSLGVDASLLDGTEPAGRGVDGDNVVQIAIVGTEVTTPGQVEAFRRLAASLPSVHPAPPVLTLPESVDLHVIVPADGGLTIGLSDDLRPFALPLGDRVLISAPTRGGKTTAARTLATAALRQGLRPTVFAGRRPIERLPRGVECIVGPAAVAEHLREHPVRPGDVVIIDELEELFDGEADFPLQEAIGLDGVSVFAACEVSQARRGYSPLLGLIKRSRRSLVLLPDADLDGDLANSPLPRTSRFFPAGRGYFSDAGRLEIVQVAQS